MYVGPIYTLMFQPSYWPTYVNYSVSPTPDHITLWPISVLLTCWSLLHGTQGGYNYTQPSIGSAHVIMYIGTISMTLSNQIQ